MTVVNRSKMWIFLSENQIASSVNYFWSIVSWMRVCLLHHHHSLCWGSPQVWQCWCQRRNLILLCTALIKQGINGISEDFAEIWSGAHDTRRWRRCGRTTSCNYVVSSGSALNKHSRPNFRDITLRGRLTQPSREKLGSAHVPARFLICPGRGGKWPLSSVSRCYLVIVRGVAQRVAHS